MRFPRRRLLIGIAALIVAGVVVWETPRARAALLATACHARIGAACVSAAWIVVGADQPRSTALLTHGCDAVNDAGSCELLTDFIATGLAGPPDYERAAKMCLFGEGRFGLACIRMADLTIGGQFGDYDRLARTERFFERACSLGVAAGCRRRATAASEIMRMRRFNDIAQGCVNGSHEACEAMMKQLKPALP